MSTSFNWPNPLRPLIDRVNAAMDAMKINTIAEDSSDGEPCIIKRRHAPGRPLSALANFYFDIAHVPIRYRINLGSRE